MTNPIFLQKTSCLAAPRPFTTSLLLWSDQDPTAMAAVVQGGAETARGFTVMHSTEKLYFCLMQGCLDRICPIEEKWLKAIIYNTERLLQLGGGVINLL